MSKPNSRKFVLGPHFFFSQIDFGTSKHHFGIIFISFANVFKKLSSFEFSSVSICSLHTFVTARVPDRCILLAKTWSGRRARCTTVYCLRGTKGDDEKYGCKTVQCATKTKSRNE